MKNILFILVFLLISSSASAIETIKGFHSDIQVLPNGSVIVKETITVNREGKQIKRGIFRDLPNTRGVNYSVLSVKRDGRKEPFFVEKTNGFYRINTGDNNFLPRNGLYTFEITYEAKNVILGFSDYDEIYWNVTGNAWGFPIENASAKVYLPDGAQSVQHAAYWGKRGSNDAARYDEKSGVFSAPKILSPGQGLTVAVGFEKGFVTSTRQPEKPLKNHIQFAALILGTYLFVSWYLYGRDPVKDAVMPRFHGIDGLTPAQAGWIYGYGHNKANCFAAALLQSVISGFLKMEGNDEIRITKIGTAKNGEEKTLERNLNFPLTLTKKYNAALKNFMTVFTTFLTQKAGEKYFTKNTLWLVIGCLLTLALLFELCYKAGFMPLAPAMTGYMIFFIPAGRAFVSAIASGKFSFSSLFVLIFVGIHFGLMSISMTFEMPETRPIIYFYALSCLSLIIYSYLIIRPTQEGMQVIAHLDGIKMFLKAVEPTFPKGVDYNKMEALLPYAVILGLEDEWEQKMTAILGGAAYKPHWYGRRRFTARALTGISSVVTKSCTPPSRSGSRGGGFSGSGFGGGGGGGR